MPNPTKEALLRAYRKRLSESNMPWTKDAVKLDRFMESVRTTLYGGNTFTRDGECWAQALKDVGLPPRVSLKWLHALPGEDLS